MHAVFLCAHTQKLITFLCYSIDRMKQIALEDTKIQMADPDASELDKAFASHCAAYLNDMISSTTEMNYVNTIKPGFLTHKDLCEVEGLHIGKSQPRSNGSSPYHFIARTYMDKAQPVTMNDGTPKPLPPGVSSVNTIVTMTPNQLVQKFGEGQGIFYGESAFWKRYHGILLGKHKWEGSGKLETDTTTVSELWDMRWLMATPEDAKNFCRDMLEVSK